MAEKVKKRKESTIAHSRYGCAIGAAYTVAAINGAVPISHASPGCVDKQYALIGSGYQGCGNGAGGDTPSVNFGENEVVFGGVKKLDAEIQSALKIVKGDLFVVLSGCSAGLIGDDVPSVVKKYQNQGYNIVHADVPGFKGNNLYGHEVVVKAIIDQFVGDYRGKKRKKLINVWTEVPYYNSNWRGDYIELKRILEGAGFDVNILFGPQSGGIEEWKTIPKAAFNLLVSPWVGLDIVKHLEEKYNQPYLHIPVLPVGEEATTEFLRKVVDFAGIDNTKAEKFIAKETKEYYSFIEHFAKFFSEYWFGIPSRFATVADTTYGIAYTKFLADQIGFIPIKVIITDNPPEKYRESINDLFHHLSEGVSVDVEYIEDGYNIEQSLVNTDFGSSIPLILGTAWEGDAARAKKALLIQVSTPIENEVILNRSFIGYKGALTLIERVFTKAVGG